LIESQELEFKTSLAKTDDGLQSLCGMLNTDKGQGTCIFGVAPDGQIEGVGGNLDSAQQKLENKIRMKFEPPIIADINVQEKESKNVITIMASRDKKVPYHEYDGRAYIREGTVTRQLSLSEKQQIQKRRDRDHHNGPWKCDKCGLVMPDSRYFAYIGRELVKPYSCQCGGEFWPA
jgi:predicted HTH transcriptional regulator